MTVPKILAGALAVNRAVFGPGLPAATAAGPDELDRSRREQAQPGAQVMIRSQGVRDVALGVGALRALVRGDERELLAWIAGHALSSVDFATTWSAREHLPKRRARMAMAIVGASAVVGAVAAVSLRPDGS